jgi:nucleotide-binding universal stress UspA family protein
MLQNILVPLDGSPVGEVVLPYAVALAGRSGARLTLIRAAHIAPLTADKGVAQVSAVSEAEAYLTLRANDLRAHDQVVETGVPYGGTAAAWIVEEAELRRADLIAMATHDRAGPDRWFHSSVAEAVVSRAAVPVLLVRGADRVRPVEHLDWRQPVLIVPLDGSSLAEAALPVAINLARSVNGRLVLVSVVPRNDESHAAHATVARDYAEATMDRATRTGVPAGTMVRIGETAQEIALAAREQNAAVVVMATHGRTGVARTVLGSIAGEVVHCSPSPVMLVRPPTLRASEAPAVVQPIAASGA